MRSLLSKYSRVVYSLILALGLILVIIVLSNTAAQKPSKNTNTVNNTMYSHSQPASQPDNLASLSLPNEKLHLSYPASWDEASDTSPNTSTDKVSPGTDNIVITSPSNLQVTISTGVVSPQEAFNNVLSSQPITTLGSSYYLDFYNDHQDTGGLAEGACVANTTEPQASLPTSKNISSTTTPGSNLYNEVCLNYPADESGSAFESSVSNFEKDQSFQQALTIIRSISY